MSQGGNKQLPVSSSNQIVNSGPPLTTPSAYGIEYYDNFSGGMYKSNGISSPANWVYLGRGMTTEFTKNSISGLAVWYDMDDPSYMTLDGSNGINVLRNKAGDSNYDLTQGTASYRPVYTPNRINGRGAAVFTSGAYSHMERDTVDIAQPVTVFFVFKNASTTAWAIPLSFSNSYLNLNNSSAGAISGTCSIYAGAYSSNIGNYTIGATSLITAVYNGASSKGSLNNGAESTLSPGTNILTSVGLGRHWGSSYYMSGDIAEVMIFTRALADTEKAYIKTYLNNKWGIYTAIAPSDPGQYQLRALSSIRRLAGNTRGSSNTNVVIYGTSADSFGSDITYNNSATAGDSFIINTSGIYSISATAYTSSGASYELEIRVGNSVDNTACDSNCRAHFSAVSGYVSFCTWTGYVAAGNRIWIYKNTAPTADANVNQVTVTRIG